MGFARFASSTTENRPSYLDWEDVKKMIKEYRFNGNYLKIRGNRKLEMLHGFRVEKHKIAGIFDVPASNLESSASPNMDEMFIAFGVKYEDLGKPVDDDQDFTTILIGIKYAVTGDRKTAEIVTTRAVDFCDPCPEECPTNLEQVLNYTTP